MLQILINIFGFVAHLVGAVQPSAATLSEIAQGPESVERRSAVTLLFGRVQRFVVEAVLHAHSMARRSSDLSVTENRFEGCVGVVLAHATSDRRYWDS